MITYEGKEQSYPSERYCKHIERQFADAGFMCEGNCYFFGYDVTVEAVWNQQRVFWHFVRHQTTQRGILIPKNAHEYAECTVTFHGMHLHHCIQLKRPFFRFMSNFSSADTAFRLRGTITEALSETIRGFLNKYDVKLLEVKNGVLTCTVIDEPEQPVVLAKSLQELIPD